MDPRFATYAAIGGVQYKFNNTLDPIPLGPISPFQIIQQEPGPASAPVPYTPWLVRSSDQSYPSISMHMFGQLFNTTIDPVFLFGVNADKSKPAKPYSLMGFEQNFENTPGVHQSEWYMETALLPGDVNSFARPFAYIQFHDGPNAGKVFTAAQYTASFTFVGGTSAAPVNQIAITDGQFLVEPANYQFVGLNGMGFATVASPISLTSPASIQTQSPNAFHSHGAVFYNNAAATVTTAVMSTAGDVMTFEPTIDATGVVGTDTNRWARVRAVAVVTGDLEMVDEQKNAHWVLQEETDRIVAINKITGKKYSISMTPID